MASSFTRLLQPSHVLSPKPLSTASTSQTTSRGLSDGSVEHFGTVRCGPCAGGRRRGPSAGRRDPAGGPPSGRRSWQRGRTTARTQSLGIFQPSQVARLLGCGARLLGCLAMCSQRFSPLLSSIFCALSPPVSSTISSSAPLPSLQSCNWKQGTDHEDRRDFVKPNVGEPLVVA